MTATYFECRSCGKISEPRPDLALSPIPCPDCAATGESDPWPSHELMELATLVLGLDASSLHYASISTVFTCAFLEGLLEKQVYMMAKMDMDYNDVGILADLLLEANQGRTRLIQLYRRVGYQPLSQDASQAGCPHFISTWDRLARARNSVLHGRPEEAEDIAPQMISLAISDGLRVFAHSHNIYNSQSIRNQIAAEHIASLQTDRDRLERWRRAVNPSSEDDPTGA